MDKRPRSYSKTDFRYWLSRVNRHTWTVAGVTHQASDYSMRLSHAGKRVYFPLNTPSKETAAKMAADLYRDVQLNGWEEATQKFKRGGAEEPAADAITIGTVISAAATRSIHLKPSTLSGYSTSLRQIAAACAGIVMTKEEKHDYVNGGTAKWRVATEAVPLASLTGAAIRKWQNAYVSAAKDPLERQRRVNSCNSLRAQASRLFSSSMLQLYRDAELDVTNPFHGVKPLPSRGGRYTARFDAAELLRDAFIELAHGSNTDKQALRVVVLSLTCGLRRGEVDRLQWSAINFEAGFLTIQTTADGAVKAVGSTRTVGLSPSVCDMLKNWKGTGKGVYVIAEEGTARPDATFRHYRASRAFNRALEWLRAKLPATTKPLHHLRKEAGAIVAEGRGIYAAATMLGHRDVRTTSDSYAHLREHIGTGIELGLAPTSAKAPEADEKNGGVL